MQTIDSSVLSGVSTRSFSLLRKFLSAWKGKDSLGTDTSSSWIAHTEKQVRRCDGWPSKPTVGLQHQSESRQGRLNICACPASAVPTGLPKDALSSRQ